MNEPTDDTPIFRIYNFFDLINTLSTSSIRLSQVSRMEDPNELFGVYFALARSPFGPHCLDLLDQTQLEFRKAKTHHYMTCWTRVPQNIAVWSLYSPGRDAIQVRTTYGKLRKAVLEHYHAWPFSRAYQLKPDDQTDLFLPPEIGPVNYVDFREVYSTLRSQCADYYKERDRWFYDQDRTDINELGKAWLKVDEQIRERVFGGLHLSGPLLKDIRYKHEKEVRFVLSLQRRDERDLEDYKSHPMESLSPPTRHPRVEDCPPNIFVPFATSNLDDFQVDGRIEACKFEAISSVLDRMGIEVKLNSAFDPIEI